MTDDHDLSAAADRLKKLKQLAAYPEWQALIELAQERIERYQVSLGKHLLSGAAVDQRALDRRIGHIEIVKWLIAAPERLEERLETDLAKLVDARKDDPA